MSRKLFGATISRGPHPVPVVRNSSPSRRKPHHRWPMWPHWTEWPHRPSREGCITLMPWRYFTDRPFLLRPSNMLELTTRPNLLNSVHKSSTSKLFGSLAKCTHSAFLMSGGTARGCWAGGGGGNACVSASDGVDDFGLQSSLSSVQAAFSSRQSSPEIASSNMNTLPMMENLLHHLPPSPGRTSGTPGRFPTGTSSSRRPTRQTDWPGPGSYPQTWRTPVTGRTTSGWRTVSSRPGRAPRYQSVRGAGTGVWRFGTGTVETTQRGRSSVISTY